MGDLRWGGKFCGVNEVLRCTEGSIGWVEAKKNEVVISWKGLEEGVCPKGGREGGETWGS